jgi:hypothetical protein
VRLQVRSARVRLTADIEAPVGVWVVSAVLVLAVAAGSQAVPSLPGLAAIVRRADPTTLAAWLGVSSLIHACSARWSRDPTPKVRVGDSAVQADESQAGV